jgi:hypothetical protein
MSHTEENIYRVVGLTEENVVKDKNRLTEDKEINLYLYNIHRGLTVRKLKYIREH